MSLIGEQVLLRIYLTSADRAPHTPTVERIVKSARSQGLAGATVLKGIMGFGTRGIIKASQMSMVEHAPVIVEIVDSAQKIERFLTASLEQILIHGLATLERASVMMYRQKKNEPANRFQLSPPQDPLSTLPHIPSGGRMTINENGVLLRVFIGESDRHAGKPLYEAILQKARELGLSGATVLRGVEGFGANSVVHKAALLEMSTDLPIVIEIVDVREKIEKLVPHLERVVEEGMITMEYVAIVVYRHNPADAPAA
jgi:PII-like signaling protein